MERLAEFRDKWIKAGLSTEPADRPRAEAGVRLAYETAGLAAPETIIWLDSPAAGVVGASLLAEADTVGPVVIREVWAQVGADVDAEMREQLPTADWQQLRSDFWATVGVRVWEQVGEVLLEQLQANIHEFVPSAAAEQVWDRVSEQVELREWGLTDDIGSRAFCADFGQQSADFNAFYDFLAEARGAKCASRMNGLLAIAQSSGWWWPFANVVILTERPVELHLDSDGRLHCEDRPALLYRDGSGVWAEHGERLRFAHILHRPDPAMNVLDLLKVGTFFKRP